MDLDDESAYSSFKKIDEMHADATLLDENMYTRKDISFHSPSSAATFVRGSSVNGYLVWKTETGEPLNAFLNPDAG